MMSSIKNQVFYMFYPTILVTCCTIETLMEWKKRVGYEVNYVSSSNIVNNRNNLKEYIERLINIGKTLLFLLLSLGMHQETTTYQHGMKIGVAIIVIQIIHILPWKETIRF